MTAVGRFEKNYFFVQPGAMEGEDQGYDVRYHGFREEVRPGSRPGSAVRTTRTLFGSPKRGQSARVRAAD